VNAVLDGGVVKSGEDFDHAVPNQSVKAHELVIHVADLAA